MPLIIIILIGIVIYQSRTNEKLNAKNLYLQKELKKYQEQNSEIVNPTDNTTVNFEKNNIISEKESISRYINKSTQKIDSQASKNLSILITGSILIVLAAIVFLTTAWQTIPNFIKTIMLFLVAFVFMGFSKLSKEKYNLVKASQTFFYISMAYLPICFLSISIFELFGTYLSVNGEGKYIYLTLSTIILSILYYYISKRSDDKNIFYGSILSQLLSVILFSLMFEERIFLVFINLLLYNLLLILITKEKIFELVIKIIPYAIAFGVICGAGTNGYISGFHNVSWYFIINCLLLAINFIYLEIKQSSIIKSLLFNLFLYIFGFCIIFKKELGFSDGLCQSLATLFTISVFVIENFIFNKLKENQNLIKSLRISSLIAIGYIYIGTLLENENMIIPSYIISILLFTLLIYNFKVSKNNIYKYLSYIFTNILLYDFLDNLLLNENIIKFIPMITTSIIMIYEMYILKSKDSFLNIYLSFFEAISLGFLAIDGKEVNSIIALLFTIFVIYYNKQNNYNKIFNSIPLLCLLPCILNTGLSNELELGILLLSTIGLTYFSVISNDINTYTIVSGIYLFITSDKISSEYYIELLFIFWGIMHVYFYKNEKAKDIFKVLTSIFITALYYSVANDLELLELTIFKLLGAVILGMYILKNIMIKYYKNYDFLEYVFWGLIYFIALSSYSDSFDGIVFSIFILGIIFFSYYKKYGSTFLSGIIAILVNAFVLTREFWFNIPWWIYLLVVGGTLVGFAIKNEANENKKKISVGTVLKEIKESVEKK